MDWGFIWLMFILKIPIAMLLGIVWWAVKQSSNPADEVPVAQDPVPRVPTPPHPRRPLPRPPRRGPHAEPLPSPPPRIRHVVAKARTLEH
jgi:hypothetical protein